MSDELRVGISVMLAMAILIAGYVRSFRATFMTKKQKIIEKGKLNGCVTNAVPFAQYFEVAHVNKTDVCAVLSKIIYCFRLSTMS